MARYSVTLRASAVKELEAIPRDLDRKRIVDRIRRLSVDPRPLGSAKLAGYEDRLRVRQGDYRIVYSADDEDQVVEIFKIGHRREVYR